MKIGILTFHRALNYGAFLQVFALKTFLEGLGHQVDIIDYWPQEHAKLYEINRIHFSNAKSIISKIKLILHFILRVSRANKKIKKMYNVQESFLQLDKNVKCTTHKQLETVQYETVIYGSDQIWWKSNISNYTGFDFAYWGDFIPKKTKKITYAASMGIMNANADDKKILSQKIQNFSKISTREESLNDFIKELGYPNPQSVIDPVFLIEKNHWLNFCKPIKIPRAYILLFNLTQAKELDEFAKKTAKKRSLQLVEVTPRIKPLCFEKNTFQTCDPFEFLHLIKNASLVITSSFHCTAFSILFEKEFISAGMSSNSERVASLLRKLGIHQSHLCIEKIGYPTSNVNYTIVNDKLKKLKKESKDFLTQSLNN